MRQRDDVDFEEEEWEDSPAIPRTLQSAIWGLLAFLVMFCIGGFVILMIKKPDALSFFGTSDPIVAVKDYTSGSAMKKIETRFFTVKDDWNISFEATHGMLSVSVIDSNGNSKHYSTINFNQGNLRSHGTIHILPGGNYRIQAEGMGEIRIAVFQGDTFPLKDVPDSKWTH